MSQCWVLGGREWGSATLGAQEPQMLTLRVVLQNRDSDSPRSVCWPFAASLPLLSGSNEMTSGSHCFPRPSHLTHASPSKWALGPLSFFSCLRFHPLRISLWLYFNILFICFRALATIGNEHVYLSVVHFLSPPLGIMHQVSLVDLALCCIPNA